ncbi:hypothetical protein QQ045_032341 [Rhodiola kirilowii]
MFPGNWQLMKTPLQRQNKHIVFNGKLTKARLMSKERHESVMNIKEELDETSPGVSQHGGAGVEKHGEALEWIISSIINVMKAGSFVSGGTDIICYANQIKKRNKDGFCWCLGLYVMVFLLVCIDSVFKSLMRTGKHFLLVFMYVILLIIL